jgi:hypothetical protein
MQDTNDMKPKLRPFKKFYCDRPETLLMPSKAFKVWCWHYSHEGERRESWGLRETIAAQVGLTVPTFARARAWLVKHGWLKLVRMHYGEDGSAYPVYCVTRGVIPGKLGSQASRPKAKKEREVVSPVSRPKVVVGPKSRAGCITPDRGGRITNEPTKVVSPVTHISRYISATQAPVSRTITGMTEGVAGRVISDTTPLEPEDTSWMTPAVRERAKAHGAEVLEALTGETNERQ